MAMIFRDAIAASDTRCAVRKVGGREVHRYWDGKIEMYTKRGRRWARWCERFRRALADPAHRDWEPFK